MVKADWLNLESHSGDYQSVADRLNGSPFDDLVEIDLYNDRCRNIYHVEGKYFVPFLEGEWTKLYRYASEHMIHPSDRGIYCALMDPDKLQSRLERSDIPGVLSAEFRYRSVEGDWIWTRQVMISGARNGLPEGVVNCYIFDISIYKQRAQGRVAAVTSASAVARRDDMTGLLLDREFFTMAQKKLPTLAGQWCIVAVDIENFKLFCDWHGQQVGHFLLAAVGEILQRVERETGGLAGYRGQDDFALLAPYDIQRLNALYEELRQLIVSQGDSVGFQPIFGICMIESPGDEIMELYNHAALTAEQIKGDFRNRIRVYNPATYKKNTEEYKILSEFQHSLERGELFFCLQPQCRVSTGNVVGAEALARWRTADGRMIPPTRFVPILERYGMVTNLDKFIWESVCKWLRKWLDEGHVAVPISVNVSQIDIFTVDVPTHFGMLLEKYSLPANLIKIEITESAYVEDTAVVRETARRLRAAGFLVLMDDFGSGYSSLNMLRSLNVDVIKLDAQFLHISENESRKGINILESIISMAKTMTIPVIVEGVETQEQINFLSDLGCRYMQGYYFYRPMPVEEFENLIRDGKNVDLNGFEFKANEQIHTRELLDVNVFNDAMLNNILGPVAIYRWKDDNVDIIRFNQQFYQMVGIELSQLNRRLDHMQEFVYPEDRDKMFDMMRRATHDRLNGAQGVLRVFKPNGALVWISLQLYLMEENDQGINFFGSAEDVTELQYFNEDLPGGYHRCTADEELRFLYISQGFTDMVGFSAEEIRDHFGNSLVNLVHKDDVQILLDHVRTALEGRRPENRPYRLKRKDGGHIFVINQSRLTDLNGELCFQGVAIDVTDMVKLRNQMRLISQFSSDDVVFVRRKNGSYKYRVVVHGLEQKLGLSAKEFEKLLNSGDLYAMMDPEESKRLAGVTMAALKNHDSFEFEFTVNLPSGRAVALHMKSDYVSDANSKVEYICIFREAKE